MAENKASDWDLGRLVYSLVLIVFLVPLVSWAWYSQFRYSIQYDVPMSQVIAAKEPHDCDFLKAPIGDKECSYDAVVTTTTTTVPPTDGALTLLNNAGEVIVSFDEGKTWVVKRSLPTKTFVYVTWKKTEE